MGSAYWAWRDTRDASILGLLEVAQAVMNAAATAEDDGVRELAHAYGRELMIEAERWSSPLPPPSVRWSELDWFRFFDAVRGAWPEPARVYPAPNRGGRDVVLNPGFTEPLSGEGCRNDESGAHPC
jgi:hypothetical protein